MMNGPGRAGGFEDFAAIVEMMKPMMNACLDNDVNDTCSFNVTVPGGMSISSAGTCEHMDMEVNERGDGGATGRRILSGASSLALQ